MLLGLNAPEEQLMSSFERAARAPCCKGFAVGRTIFAEAAEGWFAGTLDDAQARELMAETYRRLTLRWEAAAAVDEAPDRGAAVQGASS